MSEQEYFCDNPNCVNHRLVNNPTLFPRVLRVEVNGFIYEVCRHQCYYWPENANAPQFYHVCDWCLNSFIYMSKKNFAVPT